MHDPGICLQIDGQCLSCLSASCDQALPVVHIDSLINLPVHKHDKLRISSVIPLVDLGGNADPYAFAIQLLRNGIGRAKPVMTVLAIPVHGLAVKVFPGCLVL